MNKQPAKTLMIIVGVVLAIFVSAALLNPSSSAYFLGKPPKQLEAWQFNEAIKNNNIATGDWQESTFTGVLKSPPGTTFETKVAAYGTSTGSVLKKELDDAGVHYTLQNPSIGTTLIGFLGVLIFPILIIGVIYFMVVRPAQMGGNQAMSFGRSKAKRVGENGPKITFDDVAGIDEAKQELSEIVDFLKNTKKYAALGAKIPKGILLTGPPGVGKTYLARAIAGEAGVPFFHISGSDFVEMFVGVGAARVRDLFETAKAHRPSLIFVDEIDAVGRQRGAGLGGGHDEREQTLNQMLVEMDGFDPNSGVIMIAATNRPDVLDPALLRPGRFDRQIVVDVPDAPGRASILKIHGKGKPFDSNVDLDVLARRTPGFTGADLANMLNEGALLAARRNNSKIEQQDLEEALDRVVAGPQRKSRIIDAKEREIIAYHEAGHAVIGEICELTDPVHKVTILPRGRSLGSTWSVPIQDKFLVSYHELLDDIAMSLGGRVAEELVYGEIFTGAVSDLEHVTRIARAMVCEYGMSEKLGTLTFGRRSHNPFLGRDYNDERNFSEDVAKMIDDEVRSIVDGCHRRATDIIREHRVQLDAVVKGLLERESLNREEFTAIMEGRELPPFELSPEGSATTPDVPSTEPFGTEKSSKPNLPPPRFEPGPA